MKSGLPNRPARALPLLALSLATCDNPLGPEARPDCELQAFPPTLSALQAPMGLDVLHDALAHAAGPMARAIGSAELTRSLEQMAGLSTERPAPELAVASCSVVMHALDELDALPDDPATRPDRDGIRVVLILAGAAVETLAEGQ